MANPKTARQVLGEKVKAWREAAGLSISDLAVKMGTKRTFIYDIEAGRKNFTVDYWEKLLKACGVSAERAESGFASSDIDPEFQDFHRMLKIILSSRDPDLTHGIHVNLDAISDKALRLRRAKQKGEASDDEKENAQPPPRRKRQRA